MLPHIEYYVFILFLKLGFLKAQFKLMPLIVGGKKYLVVISLDQKLG